MSRWKPLIREGELLLNSPARSFQVRIVLYSAAEETPRVKAVVVQTVMRREPAAAGTIEAATIPMPELTTRAAWGAKPPRDGYNTQTPHMIVVHHAFQPDHAAYTGPATIRGIQKFHMEDRGWSDIGYHFLIGPDGKLYEGRPPTAVGAHSPPNTGKIGICAIGNFETGQDTITPVQRDVLVRVLAHLCGQYRVATDGIRAHREFQSTSCPGETLFAQLPKIRDEVAGMIQQARR
ncbi:MAG: N-acetylmuramoyl-L-alanine amidase [Candidatus Riflebacteria bacterium]|nr:N-acetylmuramoyl-L-alanine amidase [Candidatus Riflebacteria bacterium]